MEKSQKIGHKKQASNIHQWKPWLKAGVKTAEGKAIASQNGWKHGWRSAEYTHFMRTFYLRCKIVRAETDWFLSVALLMDLIHEIRTFKPSPDKNREIIELTKHK